MTSPLLSSDPSHPFHLVSLTHLLSPTFEKQFEMVLNAATKIKTSENPIAIRNR